MNCFTFGKTISADEALHFFDVMIIDLQPWREASGRGKVSSAATPE
jgi:hypothetical protein